METHSYTYTAKTHRPKLENLSVKLFGLHTIFVCVFHFISFVSFRFISFHLPSSILHSFIHSFLHAFPPHLFLCIFLLCFVLFCFVFPFFFFVFFFSLTDSVEGRSGCVITVCACVFARGTYLTWLMFVKYLKNFSYNFDSMATVVCIC